MGLSSTDIWTVVLIAGLNGYIGYRVWRARSAIRRGGPAMMAGVALVVAALICAQTSLRFMDYFLEIWGASVTLGCILNVYAVIFRGFR